MIGEQDYYTIHLFININNIPIPSAWSVAMELTRLKLNLLQSIWKNHGKLASLLRSIIFNYNEKLFKMSKDSEIDFYW